MKAENSVQLSSEGFATRSPDAPTDDVHHRIPARDRTLFTIDRHGNFKFVSEAAERLTGYSREELEKLNVLDLLPRENVRYLDVLLKRSIVEGLGTVFEIDITTRDRRQVRVEASIDFVTGKDGALEFHGIAVPQMDEGPSEQSRPRCLDEVFSFEFVAEQFDRDTIYL